MFVLCRISGRAVEGRRVLRVGATLFTVQTVVSLCLGIRLKRLPVGFRWWTRFWLRSFARRVLTFQLPLKLSITVFLVLCIMALLRFVPERNVNSA